MRTIRTIFTIIILLIPAISLSGTKKDNIYGDMENVSYVRSFDGGTLTDNIQRIKNDVRTCGIVV